MSKRRKGSLRMPREIPGRIIFKRAKGEHDGEDWYTVFRSPATSSTSRYLCQELAKIADELVSRGYDPLSIKFECYKLSTESGPSKDHDEQVQQGMVGQ